MAGQPGVIRKGMWCLHNGKIGIVYSLVGAAAEFHLVNEDGTTGLIYPVVASELTQAARADIPEVRRPTVEVARKWGYAA